MHTTTQSMLLSSTHQQFFPFIRQLPFPPKKTRPAQKAPVEPDQLTWYYLSNNRCRLPVVTPRVLPHGGHGNKGPPNPGGQNHGDHMTIRLTNAILQNVETPNIHFERLKNGGTSTVSSF